MRLPKCPRCRLVYVYATYAVILALVPGELCIPGLAIAAVGIAIRMWSAGYIIKDDHLATSGPYSMCRHPLYLGTFIFLLGSVIASRIWWLIPAYVVGFAIFYIPSIVGEQRFLAAQFGEAYAEYCRRVPAFLPLRYGGGTEGFSLANAMRIREHLHVLASVIFLVILGILGHLRATHGL
jgi:protein-S-isoprenylcysteine O-methyltransferase Ste14